VTIGILVLLLVLIGLGLGAYAITNTPQYAYYQLYQAAKARDYDKFVDYTNTMSVAQNITSDQAIFLEGQDVDLNNVKFGLKGNLEFAIDKLNNTGELEQIFPTKPANIFEAFKASDKIKYENGKMIISFNRPDKKDSIDGIGGYKTGVIYRVKGRYVLAEIKDNPVLEEQRQKLQDQKNNTNINQTNK
jgi:hypothetical protein